MDELTPEELLQFKEQLENKREEIGKRSLGILDLNVRELADDLDFASAISQNSVDEAVIKKDKALLKEIDDALQRIRDGEYGICEGSGESIPKRRIQVQPWARFTVAHQEALDKLAVRRGFRGISDENPDR